MADIGGRMERAVVPQQGGKHVGAAVRDKVVASLLACVCLPPLILRPHPPMLISPPSGVCGTWRLPALTNPLIPPPSGGCGTWRLLALTNPPPPFR